MASNPREQVEAMQEAIEEVRGKVQGYPALGSISPYKVLRWLSDIENARYRG